MQTLQEVFQRLVHKYNTGQVAFDKARNILTLPAHKITVLQEDQMIALQIDYEGQRFLQQIGKHDALYVLLNGLLSGKYALERYDDCNVIIKGNLPDLSAVNPNNLSVFRRVFSAGIGLLLVLFANIMLVVCIRQALFSTVEWMDKLIPAVFSLIPLVWGAGLLHHAIAKKPMSVARMVLFAVGSFISGSAMTMMWTTYSDLDGITPAQLAGLIFIYAVFGILGGILMWAGLRGWNESNTFQPRTLFLRRTVQRPTESQATDIIERMIANTRTQQIKIHFEPDAKPDIAGSKIGGKPYWNNDDPYPTSANGKPMVLLAQILLADLPENDMLPRSGLLQFFIADDAEYGVSQPCRLVYHRTVNIWQPEPEISPEAGNLPFKRECVIRFEPELVSISPDDIRIDAEMIKAAKQCNIPIDSTLSFRELIEGDVDNNLWNTLRAQSAGSHLFGYPIFAQEDPRHTENHYNDILLLQIDSQHTPFGINWGDGGTAGFFISPARLKNMEFKDVLYYWDCIDS